MQKASIFVLLLLIGCQRANYTSIAPDWKPDYDVARFENEIAAFENQDKTQNPRMGQIVFAGSSSFRFWKNAAQDLGIPVVNRAFGGSTLPEVLHFADRTIIKYQPKTVVIYCENDMYVSKIPKSPEQTRDAYVALVKKIRRELPQSKLFFVSLKPSPSRWSRWAESVKANDLIREFIKKDKNHEYIDITQTMMKNGRPDGSIFLKDSLHMNPEGYRRWTAVLKPILTTKAQFDN
jgi:lysophospholipase L1-like esterase